MSESEAIRDKARIYVDADACPREHRELIQRAAQRLKLFVDLVANRFIATKSPYLRAVLVSAGADKADDWIAEHVAEGDIVITADVPLAARVVPLGALVITPRGDTIDANNVGERLGIRDFLTDLRETGQFGGGPAPLSARDKARFAAALDRHIVALNRSMEA